MAQDDTNGKHGLFLHEQLSHLYTENTQMKLQTVFDEDMENKYMFVMLWNLCIISHWIFPQCSFFVSGTESKNNSRGYVAF